MSAFMNIKYRKTWLKARDAVAVSNVTSTAVHEAEERKTIMQKARPGSECSKK